MPTIIATPGAVDANSYVTLAEADAYHGTRLFNSAWTGATQANRETALIWAARILDRENFLGYRTAESQSMRWPRVDVYDRDGYYINANVVPQFLKNAQSELAFLLVQADRTVESGTEGFKKIKVGSIELEIDGHDRVKAISPEINQMLTGYVESGTRMVRG